MAALDMPAAPPLPTELMLLINDGLWPDKKSANAQHLSPLIPKEIIRRFAPDQETIFLYPPPFLTIAESRKRNKYWDVARSAVNEIDPERALVIGDFGIGSDAPIILDYRGDVPLLLRLQWGEHENHWIDCGIGVADFADLIRNNKSE